MINFTLVSSEIDVLEKFGNHVYNTQPARTSRYKRDNFNEYLEWSSSLLMNREIAE